MQNDAAEILSQASDDGSRSSIPGAIENVQNENVALNVVMNRQQYLFLFEELMSDIGYGKYQKRIELILGALMFVNGIEITVIAFTLTDFLLNNNLSENVIILLSSFIFLGFSIGSIFSKIIWNRFGYKRSLLITLMLYFLISLMSVYPFYSMDFIIFRTICAILMNLVKNFGYNLLIEFTFPMRAVQETSFNYYCYYISGQIVSSALVLFLYDYLEEYTLNIFYQLLIKFSLIIVAMAYVSLQFFVMESIKYSLYWNLYPQAFETFNHLACLNKKTNEEENYLDDLKKSSLTYWTELYVIQMEAQSELSILKKFQNIYNNTDDTQKIFSVLIIINSMIITLSFYSFPLISTLYECGYDDNLSGQLNEWSMIFINYFFQYFGLICSEIIRKWKMITKIRIVLIFNLIIIISSMLISSSALKGYNQIFVWMFSLVNAFLFLNNNEMKGYFFNNDIKETAKEVVKFTENITFLFVPFIFWSNLLFSYNYIFIIYGVLYIFNFFIVGGLYFYEKWRMQIELLLQNQQN